ncbi:MAG: aminopeptidase P family protein [Lentisphaeria bacterium]|nr:aminopeptidase P family protein [Lentisphaeria bacterium]
MNQLIYAASENNADILYATGIFVPDAFLWAKVDQQEFIVASPLEINRIKKSCKPNTQVISLYEIAEINKSQGMSPEHQVRAIATLTNTNLFDVPYDFPIGLAIKLKEQKINIRPVDKLFPQREFKSEQEISKLREGVELAEAGMLRAFEILKEANISENSIFWNNKILTSEILRGEIDAHICKLGGHASHTIVASGIQGADPHEGGHGPIKPNEPLILDIFPRVSATGYFGDLTRTVVKGKASEQVKMAFEVVKVARDNAIKQVYSGANSSEIHKKILDYFEDNGFSTDLKTTPPRGFFHGTGHGVGLEIHEAPRVSLLGKELLKNQVITIEPGLYYIEWGGIRLEDFVVVRDDHAENLTTIETFLEIP